MALPVILFGAGGSDSAASGAGPATAVGVTATASSNAGGTVVTMPSADLTNVLTDGSHVLFFPDLTAGARNFAKITGKANSGTASANVTVSDAVRGSLTSRDAWIGGKRATINDGYSRKLFVNSGSNGDMMPGWVAEMESGYTDTITARLDWYRAGDTTDGPMILRGAAGAATRPVLTFTGAAVDVVNRSQYHWFVDFEMAGTGGATSCLIDACSSPAESCGRYDGLKLSGFSGTLLESTTSTGIQTMHVYNCELSGGTVGIRVLQNDQVIGNWIHGQTSHGIHGPSGNLTGLTIVDNLITGCGGDGINLVQGRLDMYGAVEVFGNTIDGCTGDGLDYTGDSNSLGGVTIVNNSISNNGGYGILFTSLTATRVRARGAMVTHNNCYNNSSGPCNLVGVLENDPGLDPQYTNRAGNDFSIGANLKAKGFPGAGSGKVGGRGGSTTSYVDIGAAERQEPAGGGGGATVFIPVE